MIDQAIIIYCICDEVCKSLGHKDDVQARMTTAEVMTFAILAATLFNCDYKKTRLLVDYHRYFQQLLSHSQLVRRVHRVPEEAWSRVFVALQFLKRTHSEKTFIVDSFPVKAYENHKSSRARIFKGKQYLGRAASKKQYFFGIKVHMIVTQEGTPVEFMFTPGSTADIKAFKSMTIGLPEGSVLLADRAYTDYDFEDDLLEIEKVKLLAKRRKNALRQHSPSEEFLLQMQRNRIEAVFSSITSRMPKHLKVRTEKGLYLKMTFFILAYMVQHYYSATA